MISDTPMPWIGTLAKQINTEHKLVQAAVRDVHEHAIGAGRLLREAMGHIQNHGVSFLVDTGVDDDYEGAAGDDGLPC